MSRRALKEYRVIWEIHLDAYTPRDAAIKALEIMRDQQSLAVVFDVYKPPGRGVDEQPISIDLFRYLKAKGGVEHHETKTGND